MTLGRPTLLTTELIQKAQEYADLCAKRALDGGNEVTGSIAELSLYLDVARSSIYKWAEESQIFSDILEKIMSSQELALIDNGLKGTFNSTITKLMLTKHGYSDKQETDITSAGKPIIQLAQEVIEKNEVNTE